MELQTYWRKFLNSFTGNKNDNTLLPFKPVAKYNFVTDPLLAHKLHTEGFAVIDLPVQFPLEELSNLYAHSHSFSAENKGVFFGVFSNNVSYKKNIHEALCNLAANTFNTLFQNYKTHIAFFSIKTPGQNTLIPFHQDNSSVDEDNYSSINVWIPLQNVNTQNGAVWLVPKSHQLYYAHRCTSMPPLLRDINDTIYPFSIPIPINKGQAILFDIRTFHFSHPNFSTSTRAAAVYRITNMEAKMRAYYYDTSAKTALIEAWNCPEDYLIVTQADSFINRPKQGELEWKKELPIEPLQPDTFLQLAAKLKIPPVNKCTDGKGSTTFLSEPNE